MSERQKLSQLPLIAPISITPQPVQSEVAVSSCSLPTGKTAVIMQFTTQQGVQMYFISQEMAKNIAEALKERAGSGIIVVPAGTLPGT